MLLTKTEKQLLSSFTFSPISILSGLTINITLSPLFNLTLEGIINSRTLENNFLTPALSSILFPLHPVVHLKEE
jgi:hypothetical protein